MTLHTRFLPILLAAAGVASAAVSEEQDTVVNFAIRIGDLRQETVKDGWTFSANGDSEFYDTSPKAWLTEGKSPGIPNLTVVGALLSSRRMVYFEPATQLNVLKKALNKSPKDNVASMLYAGVTGQVTALNISRATNVIRLDLKLKHSGDFVLWQNVEKSGPAGMQNRKWALSGLRLESFAIRIGTLEPLDPPKSGYVFRAQGKEEIFDFSDTNHLTIKEVEMKFSGIPGLNEIGFKLDNGVEYLYRILKLSQLNTAQLAARENPAHKAKLMIFEGEATNRLEIMLSGKTPVIRVDLKIGDANVTLWSNAEKAESVKKGEPK